MNKKFIFIFIVTLFAVQLNAQKVKNIKLKTHIDSLSYAFGISIADNLKTQKIENINPQAIGRAFQDFYNKEPKISADTANKMIQKHFEDIEAQKHQATIDEGKKFLAENAKKEGVVTLPSGLQYKIIKKGTGNIPTASDKVKVNYEGTLIDGTKFDSSYDRGQPVEFAVTQVIKGWTEALQLMKEGSVWMLYIPYNLAYGSRSAGKIIKPFSTLIFKVELLSIVK
ncbi:MAG: FKBP-type peptidyl-prolyl cis-trans isomerase [Bacteroidales bacterium]|nr:FKBP-type peptidyl-prolyl cis-trans isomerase [Bacteroidales bacterium]